MKRKARTKAKLKERIICKGCHFVFKNESKKIMVECPSCSKQIDARNRTGYAKEYLEKHPERLVKAKEYDKKHGKERRAKQRKHIRASILNIISDNNPICVNCGCNDTRLLEINHINGGGNKEYQKGKHSNKVYWDIYMLRRKTDDLELLCKVCNAKHYLELLYGELPIKITWTDNTNV